MATNTFTVTTALMIAFALFVGYIRMKNWLDSNVPIFFYVAMIFYTRAAGDSRLPMWLVLVGFAFSLTLRFEFMNPFFTKLMKFLELATLAVIVYLLLATLLA
jgi:hypothetical protein